MLNTGMSLSGAGKGSSRSMSLGWKVEGKGWMEASIRTKVTEKRPEAARFLTVAATVGIQNMWIPPWP